MSDLLLFTIGWVIGLAVMFSLELVYDYLSARFQRSEPDWEPMSTYSLEDVIVARDAMRASLFRTTTELERKYTGPELNEGDRVGVDKGDGVIHVGIVKDHREVAPDQWTITLEGEQS